MNFRDLMKRYKEGRATEEEKRKVEKELDKYATIEEYYTEELSDDFMDGDFEDASANNESEGQNINKVVNRRLGKVVLISVLSAALLYFGIFYGLSSMVDQFYFDPTETSQSSEEDFARADFQFDMDALISLNMPGYVNSTFTIQESEGFGNYKTAYFLKDLFTKEDSLHSVDIKRGRPQNFYGGVFDRMPSFSVRETFTDVLNPIPDDSSEEGKDFREEFRQKNNKKTMDYIENLNPLSYLSMNIAFDEDLSMTDLYQLTEEHPELNFKWAGIRTVEEGKFWNDNQPMHLVGFVPDVNAEPSSNIEPDADNYPLFSLNDLWLDPSGAPEDFIPEAYSTHFKSRISWLKDREEFVKIFDYNEDKTEFYADALNYVEENGVKTYGVLVYGTAEAFSESLNDFPYDRIIIDEVDSSKPSVNIYYD